MAGFDLKRLRLKFEISLLQDVSAMIGIFILIALIYGSNGYGNSICANMTTADTPNAKKCLKAAYENYNYTKLDIIKMKYLHALITGI